MLRFFSLLLPFFFLSPSLFLPPPPCRRIFFVKGGWLALAYGSKHEHAILHFHRRFASSWGSSSNARTAGCWRGFQVCGSPAVADLLRGQAILPFPLVVIRLLLLPVLLGLLINKYSSW